LELEARKITIFRAFFIINNCVRTKAITILRSVCMTKNLIFDVEQSLIQKLLF